MRKFFILISLIFLCLSLTVNIFAQATSALVELHKKGLKLVQKGKCDSAIIIFQKVIDEVEKNYDEKSIHLTTPFDMLSLSYQCIRKYNQADSLFNHSLKIRKKVLGQNHPDVAISLNFLGELYRIQNQCDKAEAFHRRALKLREDKLPPDDFKIAESLHNLALTLVCTIKYLEADSLYDRALQILIKTSVTGTFEAAQFLYNSADLKRILGKLEEAESLAKQSLSIKEKLLHKYHPSLANSCNLLAAIYVVMGRYPEAELFYLRAIEILKISAPGSRELLTTMDNLATLYSTLANYEKAEKINQEVLSRRKSKFGLYHPDVATSLNHLGLLYHYQGNYVQADSLYKQALMIREKTPSENHPDVANSLICLGNLCRDLGKYSEAESYYQRALVIRINAYGEIHLTVATTYDNLAFLYHKLRRYAEAYSLYRKALDIRTKILGNNHPDVAISLNNIASICHRQGKNTEVDSLYNCALKILLKNYGTNHQDVATVLNNIAVLNTRLGEYFKADSLLKKALSIWEEIFRPNHPNVSTTLSNLAMVNVALQMPADAIKRMRRSFLIDEHTISMVFNLTSEKDKFAFMNKVSFRFDLMQNLVVQALSTNEEAIRICYDGIIRRKGEVLDALSRERHALFSSNDAQVIETFQKLQATLDGLSELTLKGSKKKHYEAYKKRLAQLEAEKENLEEQLARLSKIYQSQKDNRSVTIDSVAQALEPGSVLIEYVLLHTYDFKTAEWGNFHYLAFILPAGNRARPKLIDLGEAVVIDTAVQKLHENITQVPIQMKQKQFNETDAEKKLAKQSHRLYQLIFQPIEKFIGNDTTIYLSPDGSLNLIPFDVLTNGEDKYLIEKYQFNYLSCGRDMVKSKQPTETGDQVIIMADPDFESDIKARNYKFKEIFSEDLTTNLRGIDTCRSKDLKSNNWGPLNGTKYEAVAIKEELSDYDVKIYLGAEASEEVFKQLKSPKILHLSTHGFFLPDENRSALYDQDDFNLNMQAIEQRNMDYDMELENPLLRSGLVLAGANRLGKGKLKKGNEDGILTALEISGMNFWGTDLVVLSACESGLGDIRKGEGVFGLRRAFQLAGAKTIVMSLWKVSDEETRKLMVHFYKQMKQGKGKARALKEAQLEMIKVRREKHGTAHPFFWGAFICVGSPE